MLKKAVFPVAGRGTRFLPATKASPKEMMPVVDKPLIQYAVEEAIDAGITDLIFVTSSSKRAIEDHFDNCFELEYNLEQEKKFELLDIVKNVLPKGISCTYLRQPEALGLGHAILCAKHSIGKEPFAVLLADDLIDGKVSCLKQMIAHYNLSRKNIIAVEKIQRKDSDKYGIITPVTKSGSIIDIVDITEKPEPALAASNFGVVGRYILPPSILDELEAINTGKDGEIQLTDAIKNLLHKEPFVALEFQGSRYDCGNKLGYLKAIVNYALKHNTVGEDFKDYLSSFIYSGQQ